jgi:hypothetical protein
MITKIKNSVELKDEVKDTSQDIEERKRSGGGGCREGG